MDYSWNNLRNIYQHIQKLGMLSPPEDVVALGLVFSSISKVDQFLELGSYIGGGIGIFNEALQETGHHNVHFTGVDNLAFIDAKQQGKSGAWYSDHFNKCLSAEELASLAEVTDAAGASNWIAERIQRLTGKSVSLTCYKKQGELGSTTYDIIHQDIGDGVKGSLLTIEQSVPLLKDSGIYIVDDWCTGAPLRTYSTVIAVQKGLLYPVLWGKNKVFFAKSKDRAQEIVDAILSNPKCDPKLFKLMPGSDYFGTGYRTVRMHWQAMQWS